MKRILCFITLMVLIVIFAVSTYFFVSNQIESREQKEIFNDIVSVVETESNDNDDKLNGYMELKSQNADFIGWIKIDDTNINYPVMQSRTPNFYLRKNFNIEYSYYGTPYISELCSADKSDNLIIYAHNMKDHQMFGDLEKYKSKDFYNSHRYVQFDTLNNQGTYEIISVFKTTADDFDYQNYTDFTDEEQFNTFIDKCKSLSLYDTETNAAYGDRLITLSTCEYSQDNGRLVVIAKQTEVSEYET